MYLFVQFLHNVINLFSLLDTNILKLDKFAYKTLILNNKISHVGIKNIGKKYRKN